MNKTSFLSPTIAFLKKSLAQVLLLVPTSILVAQAPMGAGEAQKLRLQVKALAEKTQTITADFVQYQHIEYITKPVESSGKMAFSSPNWVKWEYLQPDPYSILFKDGKLYSSQNGKKSTVDMGSNTMFKKLNQLITASIQGDMFDSPDFKTSFYKVNEDHEVRFEPRDANLAEVIQAIQITFNPQGEVRQVKLMEVSQDHTTIVFSNRKTNAALPSDTFVE